MTKRSTRYPPLAMVEAVSVSCRQVFGRLWRQRQQSMVAEVLNDPGGHPLQVLQRFSIPIRQLALLVIDRKLAAGKDPLLFFAIPGKTIFQTMIQSLPSCGQAGVVDPLGVARLAKRLKDLRWRGHT